MPIALQQFVKQLEESGIVSPGTIREFLPSADQPQDAAALARALIRNNHLTKYQAEQVVRGKAKSLFLGNYLVLDKIGQGGMGQVFKAQHRRMDRVVAIKILPPEVTRDPASIARFEREVRTAAKLDHRNIVTAYDADQADGVHFLVMQFVDGSDLSALVKRDGPFGVDEAVNYVQQAARGLSAAHADGVVHRDIKPANLLLDKKGTIKILDMGLARIQAVEKLRTQTELTSSGVVMGTVDYMAPEQALDAKSADARADIYSLGCTLYYLLTARPTYDADSLVAKLLAHRDKPIPSLRVARAEVPESLDAIFRKMVAKSVEDRYQTMSEVIAALEQVVRGATTVEEPRSRRAVADTGLSSIFGEISLNEPQELVPKKQPPPKRAPTIPRRTFMLGSAVGGLVLMAVTIAVLTVPRGDQKVPAPPAKIVSQPEIKQATKSASVGAEANPGAAQRRAASVAAMEQMVAVSDTSLTPFSGAPNSRTTLVYRPTPMDGVLGWTVETRRYRGMARDLAYDPDGRWLALASVDGAVRLYDAKSGRLERVLLSYDHDLRSESTTEPWSLAWHPGGRVLAVGGDDKAVRLWDARAGKIIRVFSGLEGPVVRLAWSGDGAALACDAAVGQRDGVCSVWDLATNRPAQKHPTAPGGRGLAWSPDGRFLALCGNPLAGTLEILDLEQGSTRSLVTLDSALSDIAWSSDGSTIATAVQKGLVMTWDARTGKARASLELPGATAVAWSPDGALLAGGAGNHVRVWEVATGRLVRSSDSALPIPPFAPPYSRLSWSPDGARLAGKHSLVGAALVWDTSTGVRVESAEPQPANDFWDVNCWWKADSKTIVLVSHDRLVFVDVPSWRMVRSVPLADIGWGAAFALAPDDRMIARLEEPGQVRFEDLQSGKELGRLAAPRQGNVFAAAWSPDSKQLALGSHGLLQIIDFESKTEARRIDGRSGPVHALAWSGDGTRLAAGEDGSVSIFDAVTGEQLQTLNGGQQLVVSLLWSADKKLLLSGGNQGGDLRIWNLQTGECRAVLNDHVGAGTWALGWLEEGRTILTGGPNRSPCIWDVQTGKLLRMIQNTGPAASPDLKLIALTSAGAFRLFDFASGEPLGAAVSLPDSRSLIVGPTGHYAVTGGTDDEVVYVVQTESGQQTLSPPEFAARYAWKNEPARAKFAFPATTEGRSSNRLPIGRVSDARAASP